MSNIKFHQKPSCSCKIKRNEIQRHLDMNFTFCGLTNEIDKLNLKCNSNERFNLWCNNKTNRILIKSREKTENKMSVSKNCVFWSGHTANSIYEILPSVFLLCSLFHAHARTHTNTP